jgi:SAM-dependent methyltransferase
MKTNSHFDRSEPAFPFTLWKRGGITEHLGGLPATRYLLDRCQPAAGARVLDVGCGTGYTATTLARNGDLLVVALDVMEEAMRSSASRAAAVGLGDHMGLVQGDALRLPFVNDSLDCILAESILVFCPAATVAAEFWRCLRPGGCVAVNEFTLLRPAAPALERLLQRLGVRTYDEAGWRRLLMDAGFVDVASAVRPISLRVQMSSHLRVDGLRGYLDSARRALAEPAIRQGFLNREMLAAFRQFRQDVGYGLYTATRSRA